MMAGVVLLTGALALVTMAAYFMFQSMAPEPYMVSPTLPNFKTGQLDGWAARLYLPSFLQDEIFHVPQTQRYCAGQWREWDSKITTFPGLYFLGVVFGRAAHAVATVQGLQVPPAAVGMVAPRLGCHYPSNTFLLFQRSSQQQMTSPPARARW